MSLDFSLDLQGAIYQRLVADPDLSSLIGGAVYDAPPEVDPAHRLAHVMLGEERARPFDTKTSRGAIHEFPIVVSSGAEGFAAAKRIASAVCAALVDAPLSIGSAKLVSLRFLRAVAERGAAPEKRRVSLLFRAVIDQDL